MAASMLNRHNCGDNDIRWLPGIMTTVPTNDKHTDDLSDQQLQSFVDFACDLADAAAAITLTRFRQSLAVENKLVDTGFDPVTAADRAAEKAMRELITERYPSHGILGEEYGHSSEGNRLTWVLDPIDGTRAFISGLPTWGTLIALYDGVKPVLGVMDQPFTAERYLATAGSDKTTCVHRGKESQLSTRHCHQLSVATMMSTAPDMFDAVEFEVQQKLAGEVRLMRYGGDCYAYCMLAGGHVDLVVEAGLSTYDIQALIPIVENAGGVVTDWQGGSAVNGGQVLASATQELHQQALARLQPAAKKSASIL